MSRYLDVANFGLFSGCTNLAVIKVSDDNSVYDSREGCNAIIKTNDNTLIAGCNNTKIPGSVTSIGSYACYDCSNLTSITLPNNVMSIGDYAFHGTAWYNNKPDGLIYVGKFAYAYKGIKYEKIKIYCCPIKIGID